MELKQRKRINNLRKFDDGKNLSDSVKGIGGDATGTNTYKQQSTSLPTKTEINGMKTSGGKSFGGGIDEKVGFGQQYRANELKEMIGGNAPIAPSHKQQIKNRLINNNPSDYASPDPSISTGAVTGAVNGTIGMIQGYNSMQDAVKGTDELMSYSGQRTDQAFGVNYQAQNDINRQKAMDDISRSNRDATLGMVGSGAAAGAAVGSVIPGVGTLVGGAAGAIVGLVGGLFGSKKARERQRRKIFNAQQNVNLINQVNQSSAATEGLTQQYYLNNGNTYDDVLYANRGKDLIKPRYVKRK